jgi:hypothetical protein
VNSGATNTRAKAGILGVQPIGNRCSAAILTRNFSSQKARETQNEEKPAKSNKPKPAWKKLGFLSQEWGSTSIHSSWDMEF